MRNLDSLLHAFVTHGDQPSIEALVRQTRPRLLRAARRIGAPQDAEDTVQSAYYSLLRAGDLSGAPPLAWLLTAVVRIAYRRRAVTLRQTELARRLERPLVVENTLHDLERAERSKMLHAEIAQLPARYADVLVLRSLEGLSSQETAYLLDVPVSTVTTRLRRARRLLRSRLSPRFAYLGLGAIWALQDSAHAATPWIGGIVTAKTTAAVGGLLVAAGLLGSGAARLTDSTGATTLRNDSDHRVAELRSELASAREAEQRLRERWAAAEAALRDSVAAEAAARYLTEINNAAGWSEAWGLVRRMVAELSPQHAWDVMNAIYRRIDDVDKRKQILKPFVFGEGHPYALDVLHLAATDPEMAVRGRAFAHLRQYAYRDFSEDMDAYDAWRRQYGDRPLAETLRSNLRAFVERLRGADEEAYAKAMGQFLAHGGIFKGAGVDMASVLQEAGLATLLSDRLSRPPPESEADRLAAARTEEATWSWLILSDPDGRVARPLVEEVLGSPDAHTPAAVSRAIRALGGIRAQSGGRRGGTNTVTSLRQTSGRWIRGSSPSDRVSLVPPDNSVRLLPHSPLSFPGVKPSSSP